MEFYATCPARFETALADELKQLNMQRVRPLTGRVTFEGAVRDALAACLWSRLASRICVVLGRVDAGSEEALYASVRALAWEEALRPHVRIAISANGTNHAFSNSHFAALRTKDALCDRLAERTGSRPQVDTEHPDAHIILSIRGDRATLALDLAGEPLFKRLPRRVVKYLTGKHTDVLRPDYAALMLACAGWHPQQGQPNILVDAACKTGGVVLEAAEMLLDRAPGMNRATWGFQGWAAFDPAVWQELLGEARQRTEAAAHRRGVIVACDADARAQAIAQGLVEVADCEQRVSFVSTDAAAVGHALHAHDYQLPQSQASLVMDVTDTSPAQLAGAIARYRQIAQLPQLEQGTAAVLAADDATAGAFPTAPTSTLAIMPNNQEARLVAFSLADAAALDIPTVDVGSGAPIPVLRADSEQFARRLIKVARERRRWAKREGISCYRVYDADLPEYAASIDLYQGTAQTPGRWLVISEYAAPKDIDPGVAQARMLDILAIAPRVLDVDPACVHARVRSRSRGGSQYGRRRQEAESTRALPRIQEDGLTFLVNFDDYLDVGIFLDHRVTRHLLREEAAQARSFLNLFAYTGTATVYAAAGGVERTTTVDLSNTYLDWAQRNMRANGFTGRGHEFVRADVMSWVRDQRHSRNRWDLIFCDPPTFSNSTKMGRRTFDVQRDHVDLIIGISRLLTPGGLGVFSCNLRTFKPDRAALERAGVVLEDVTEKTIPEDFRRNRRIHQCYLVYRA